MVLQASRMFIFSKLCAVILFKFQWHIEKLQQESLLLGPGFDLISHVSRINIIKSKRNPELQENRGRIVGNNILSRYRTLDFLKNIPISTRHCMILIGINNYRNLYERIAFVIHKLQHNVAINEFRQVGRYISP